MMKITIITEQLIRVKQNIVHMIVHAHFDVTEVASKSNDKLRTENANERM